MIWKLDQEAAIEPVTFTSVSDVARSRYETQENVFCEGVRLPEVGHADLMRRERYSAGASDLIARIPLTYFALPKSRWLHLTSSSCIYEVYVRHLCGVCDFI